MSNETSSPLTPEVAFAQALEHLKIIRAGVSSIRQWVTFFGILWIIAAAILLIGFLMNAAAHAESTNGSVVSSFQSPAGLNSHALEYYNGYLYLVGGSSSNVYLYHITTTGSVLSSSVHLPNAAEGLDYKTGGIWTCTSSAVYNLTTTGSIITSFATPASADVAFDGAYLWLTTSPGIIRMSTTGTIHETVAITGYQPAGGIDTVSPSLSRCWFAAKGTTPTGNRLLRADFSGEVLENLTGEGTLWPGVTWDGNYLWYVNELGWIYRVTTDETAIAPVSLGKIKTLYR